MCGFTGFWTKSKNITEDEAARIALNMANAIANRGPDSCGSYANSKNNNVLAIGHRRLSIVDLSENGHQPMFSNSKRMVVAYNGEIYNSAAIKKELEQAGIKFRGHSDTEVLVEACDYFGVETAVKKFIGMFAFALFDINSQQIYLVCDRLGIKPVYFGVNNNVFFFGSQLKSFYPHPLWKPSINRRAQAEYFKYNYVPYPLSIIDGIKKLNPGHIVVINANFEYKESCYWAVEEHVVNGISNRNNVAKSDQDYVSELELLLKDAVGKRMIADVPLGAFLSGGVDSSTVAALMQTQSARPINTFSIGFNEAGYNEAPFAKTIAEYLKTDHQELYVTSSEAEAVVYDLPDYFDEPFADSSQIPTYLLSKMTRQHVKVALSGDGGDELFAGYNRYLIGSNIWPRLQLTPIMIRNLLAAVVTNISPNTWDNVAKFIPILKNKLCVGDKAHKFANILKVTSEKELYKALVCSWNNKDVLQLHSHFDKTYVSDNYGSDNHKLNLDNKVMSFLDWMQYSDIKTYLPGDILTKVDRASMAVSLEARVPLLDHRVVEFVWGLPLALKIRNNQSKWLLRQVLYKYVPKALIERPKMGFGVPIEKWLRSDLKPWASELLSKKNLEASGLNANLINKVWQEHLSGTRNWQHKLWGILMFQAWSKKWL